MLKQEIIAKLRELAAHNYFILTVRGNSAIKAAVSAVAGTVLIPQEGGWLEYKKIKNHEEVNCDDAVIDLNDLKSKLSTGKFKALIYQNPAGYFAEQPMQDIYELCSQHGCLAILHVSGCIGTELCQGKFADIIVGSFGRWKPVNAGIGGFISCKEKELFERIDTQELSDLKALKIINEKLNDLDDRISFLTHKVKRVKEDLSSFNIVHAADFSLLVVVRFSTEKEKGKIIDYCIKNKLEWTECPRYIRLNEKAISIEVKRLK
jgi:hypothetical protein